MQREDIFLVIKHRMGAKKTREEIPGFHSSYCQTDYLRSVIFMVLEILPDLTV